MNLQAPLLASLMALLLPGGAPVAQAVSADTAIAVVVAPTSSQSLDLDKLTLIYRRKKLFWNEGTRVAPINLQASDPLRQLFSRRILHSSPEDMEGYWNDLYFHGVSPPRVLVSAEAVLRFVAQSSAAIGYVAYCDADTRVRVALVLTSAGPISEATAAGSISCPAKQAIPTGG